MTTATGVPDVPGGTAIVTDDRVAVVAVENRNVYVDGLPPATEFVTAHKGLARAAEVNETGPVEALSSGMVAPPLSAPFVVT